MTGSPRVQRPQVTCSANAARNLAYARSNGTNRLASGAFADDVCVRFRTSLCRFLRNIFIAELASGVGSVSPCFNNVIKQRASRDCLSEASNAPNIGSNSTNAQAFTNAVLKISVSAESKKCRPKLIGVVALKEVMKVLVRLLQATGNLVVGLMNDSICNPVASLHHEPRVPCRHCDDAVNYC